MVIAVRKIDFCPRCAKKQLKYPFGLAYRNDMTCSDLGMFFCSTCSYAWRDHKV